MVNRKCLSVDYIYKSSCGLTRVRMSNGKYGYMNSKNAFEIEPVYDWADDFSEGLAWARRGEDLFILRRDGSEIKPEPFRNGSYARVEKFKQGLARVSTVDMGGFWAGLRLAYHHDDSDNAGVWGYVNVEGKVVVEPQYIFGEDFGGGLAVVCEGKWTREERMGGRWWSEKMLWGAINRRGEVAVPCKFDAIKWRPPRDGESGAEITRRYLAARDVNLRWGLIDFQGRWRVKPQFGDIGYELQTSPNGDMFVFYRRDIWGGGDPDSVPNGVYSLRKNRVLIPAEKYVDIDFVDDNTVTTKSLLNGKIATIDLNSLSECNPGVLYEDWQDGMP